MTPLERYNAATGRAQEALRKYSAANSQYSRGLAMPHTLSDARAAWYAAEEEAAAAWVALTDDLRASLPPLPAKG